MMRFILPLKVLLVVWAVSTITFAQNNFEVEFEVGVGRPIDGANGGRYGFNLFYNLDEDSKLLLTVSRMEWDYDRVFFNPRKYSQKPIALNENYDFSSFTFGLGLREFLKVNKLFKGFFETNLTVSSLDFNRRSDFLIDDEENQQYTVGKSDIVNNENETHYGIALGIGLLFPITDNASFMFKTNGHVAGSFNDYPFFKSTFTYGSVTGGINLSI